MTTGSKLVLYLLFGGPVVVLFLLGPLGWVTAAFLVLGGRAVTSLTSGDGDETPARTHCSGCDAPNDPDADRCRHCEDPL